MQPLDRLNNVQLAKLLASLFPDVMPSLLSYLQKASGDTAESADELKKDWPKNAGISPERWVGLAKEVTTAIKRYGPALGKRPSLFADQLFDGYVSLYTTEVVFQFACHEKCPPRFRQSHSTFFR